MNPSPRRTSRFMNWQFLLLFLGLSNAASGGELLTNGSFDNDSSLSSWQYSGPFTPPPCSANAFSNPNCVCFTASDGSGVNNGDGFLYQQITLPSNATLITFTYYLNITTQEAAGASAFDYLYVTLRDTSNTVVETVATYSNQNAGALGVYTSYSRDVTSWKGQTIRFYFRGTTDISNPTKYRIDNVSVNATIPDTRTLTVASSNPSSNVSITVSPNDNNGNGNGSTQFTRTYNLNTSVTLTAPSTANGNNFQKWQKDGVDLTTNTSTGSFAMDADHTLTAVYVTPPQGGISISRIEPNPATGLPCRQLLTLLGTGFSSGMTVVLRNNGQDYVIPQERTIFLDSTRAEIIADLTTALGTWTARISAPSTSNLAEFSVVASPQTPISLRVPWTRQGDPGQPERWIPQTYISASYGPHHPQGAKYAVDFYYKSGVSSCATSPELGLHKLIRAAHTGYATVSGELTCPIQGSYPDPQYRFVEICGFDLSSTVPVKTRYVHLDPTIADGDFVHAGDVIGTNNKHGCVLSGPHLHFEAYRLINGNWSVVGLDSDSVTLDGETILASSALCSGYNLVNDLQPGQQSRSAAMPRSGNDAGGLDSDFDGVDDDNDVCPGTVPASVVDAIGCSSDQTPTTCGAGDCGAATVPALTMTFLSVAWTRRRNHRRQSYT